METEQNIKNLLQKVSAISKKYEDIAKITGENFNIFKVMDMQSNEVNLHSSFIAELLNPEGSHGQGNAFLKLFTKQCEIENFNIENAIAEVEKYIGEINEDYTEGGRIDIIIEDNKKRKIIIENKIYAKDQKNQLLRYYNYDTNADIFYLTLYGEVPSDYSIGEGGLKMEDVKLLSYSQDVKSWLEECKKEAVNFPILRETITQYIHIIKYLTGQTMNQQIEKQIINIIALTPDNIKNSIDICSNINNAKVKIQWLFWKFLKEKYINLGVELIEHEKTITWSKVNSFYNNSRNKAIYYGLWSKIYEKNNITIHYGIEIGDAIYYGFTIERNGTGRISLKEEFENVREVLKKINSKYDSNDWWIGVKNTDIDLNFREFNSSVIFNLADRDFLSKIVAEIAENSVKDIKAFKDKLQNITIN